jgi:hypothetical protein
MKELKPLFMRMPLLKSWKVFMVNNNKIMLMQKALSRLGLFGN